MKLKTRQDYLVVLTIGAGVLLVMMNYIFPVLGGWWDSRYNEIKDLKDKIRDGQVMIKRESALRDQWQNIQDAALPPDNSRAEQQLLKSFDNWRSDTGADVSSILPQWKNEGTNYMTISCRVELGGSLGTLSKYLYDVENGTVALRVDSAELSTHDNLGEQLTLDLEVNGLALMRPATQPAVKK